LNFHGPKVFFEPLFETLILITRRFPFPDFGSFHTHAAGMTLARIGLPFSVLVQLTP
jgi:hypothetical protein